MHYIKSPLQCYVQLGSNSFGVLDVPPVYWLCLRVYLCWQLTIIATSDVLKVIVWYKFDIRFRRVVSTLQCWGCNLQRKHLVCMMSLAVSQCTRLCFDVAGKGIDDEQLQVHTLFNWKGSIWQPSAKAV